MEIKPESFISPIITLAGVLVIVGIAYGETNTRLDNHEAIINGLTQSEEKIEDKVEKRVDAKLNKIDRRLERIEDLIIGFKK